LATYFIDDANSRNPIPARLLTERGIGEDGEMVVVPPSEAFDPDPMASVLRRLRKDRSKSTIERFRALLRAHIAESISDE